MDLNEQLSSFISAEDDSAGIPLTEEPIQYVPDDGTSDILQGLLSLNSPAEASTDQILAAASFQEDTTRTSRDQAVNILQALRAEAADGLTPTLNSFTEAADAALVGEIDQMSGGKIAITVGKNEQGNRTIQMSGQSDEFQGLGKYTSPEEFMRLNPDGFKKTNPVLWERMQADARARAEAPTQLAQKMNNELTTKMQAIQQESDPLKKEMMLSELKSSVAIAGADMTKQMRILAEDKAGVAKIRSLYEQSLQADIRSGGARTSVTIGKDGRPTTTTSAGHESVATKNYRMQLQQAEQNVKIFTKQMISENPTLASLSERLKGFVSTQERLLTADLKRLDVNQERLQAVAETLTPDAVKRLTYLQPDIQGNEQKAAAYILNKGKLMDAKGKQGLMMVLEAPDAQSLIPLALSNNPGAGAAREVVIQEQMLKTGQSREDVLKDTNKFAAIMTNEAAFKTALDRLPQTEQIKRMKTEYALLSQAKGKETEASKMAIRGEVAQLAMKDMKTREILGDVWSWQALRDNPAMLAAYDKIKTTSGKKFVSVDDFISGYVNTAPREQRAALMEQVQMAALAEGRKYRQAVFGGVDEVTLTNTIKAKSGVTSKLAGSIEDFAGSLNIGGILPQNMMGGFQP